MINYVEKEWGVDVNTSLVRALFIAISRNERVLFEFNGDKMLIKPMYSLDMVKMQWTLDQQKRKERYQRSPQFALNQKRKNQLFRWCQRDKERGIVDFAIKDKKLWRQFLDGKQDDLRVARFVSRFASRIEKLLEETHCPIHRSTAWSIWIEENTEGLSGNYNKALQSVLKDVWEHGHMLNDWNL